MNLNITKESKILVVAPHQDDESIGCGGLLALYGKQCDVLLLTDGRYGNPKKLEVNELIKVRNKELDKATKIAKVNKVYRLNILNEALSKSFDLVKDFSIVDYDFVFIPYRKDIHEDHKVVFKFFRKMKHNQKAKALLMEYEVWTPILTPTCLLDITKVIEKKKKMLDVYESQSVNLDYCRSAIGLNLYRGMQVPCKYAEAYMDSRYYGIKTVIYNLLPNSLKNIIKRFI